MTYRPLTIAVPLGLFLAGCSSNVDETAGIKIPDGQFFRVVNGTESSKIIAFDGLPVQNPATPAFSPCTFRKASPKKHRFTVFDEKGVKLCEKEFTFKGGEIVTYVLRPEGKSYGFESITQEKRDQLKGKAMVRLVGDNVEGAGAIKSASGSLVSLADAPTDVPPGDYVVSGPFKTPVKAEVEVGFHYSLLQLNTPKGPKAIWMINSPEKMGQASATVSGSAG